MPNDLETIFEAVRQLNASGRRELIDRLKLEFDQETSPEVLVLDPEQEAEIRKRVTEHRAGQGQTFSWQEVQASLRGRE